MVLRCRLGKHGDDQGLHSPKSEATLVQLHMPRMPVGWAQSVNLRFNYCVRQHVCTVSTA